MKIRPEGSYFYLDNSMVRRTLRVRSPKANSEHSERPLLEITKVRVKIPKLALDFLRTAGDLKRIEDT